MGAAAITGKSTLLQLLAGKKLINTPGAELTIKGQDVFRNSPSGVTFLGTEWAMNPVVRGDIVVSAFLDSVGGYRHKERRDILLDILDIDLDWHMHQISDDATHIFDGLNNFPTHVAHMRYGSFVTLPTPYNPNPSLGTSSTSTLYNLALQWLKEDRDYRRELERNGQQITRGARRDQAVPSDSETFYRK
ncbi:ABC transporter domain-containing protein C20G4.01 [Psilocybe cubensis]|uniref:ABC transporter domain-containing protein C20G4.01 n=1 Tax=Psilocybe cubensis TaxID=181762 RepID=A0ACB8H4P7_PSICU|nr:ABC transporter domain-containing protein C20G4.01 [Psilocybe cubensis]KAH9482980.1 ABC transporter domain-containing protein C20G4.01 [Psilocybe cubensis]